MARKITVELIGDSSSLEKSFKRSAKAAQGFKQEATKSKSGGLFGALTKGAGLATAALGAGGLAAAVKASTEEFMNAQKVAAQTNAAIKSTGAVANVSAKHVDALATAMMNKTGIDDEATKTAENMLLSFTNVRNQVGKNNKIFDQATQATADLATRMNGGAIPSAEKLSKTSILVGKALNDPIKGLGALSRVGVQFTEKQKDAIKAMVKSHNVMGAQKVILGELRREFGGSAAAAGKTLGGQFEKLRNIALNLGASVIGTLMPAIQKTVTQITNWLSKSKNQKQILDNVNAVVKALSGGLKVLRSVFETLNKITGSSRRTFELLLGTLIAIKGLRMASNMATLARNMGLVGTKAAGARGGVMSLRGSLVGKAGLAAGVALAGWELSKVIRKIPGWDNAMKNFGAHIHDVLAKAGLIHDPMKQFAGKTLLSPAATKFLRNQAARLEASGLTRQQTAGRLVQTHPGIAMRDARVIAGVYGRAPVYHIENLHLNGIQNPKQMEEALTKRSKARSKVRRGAR